MPHDCEGALLQNIQNKGSIRQFLYLYLVANATLMEFILIHSFNYFVFTLPCISFLVFILHCIQSLTSLCWLRFALYSFSVFTLHCLSSSPSLCITFILRIYFALYSIFVFTLHCIHFLTSLCTVFILWLHFALYWFFDAFFAVRTVFQQTISAPCVYLLYVFTFLYFVV